MHIGCHKLRLGSDWSVSVILCSDWSTLDILVVISPAPALALTCEDGREVNGDTCTTHMNMTQCDTM